MVINLQELLRAQILIMDDYYYEQQECKDVAKLKLVYNKNNHELTIHSSRGETQSNKKKQIENKKNR